MSDAEVDDYLAAAPEPQRSTLEQLRATLVALLPDADQGIAYGVPCFKVGGKAVAGFASYPKHCSYLPMSGSITAELADELSGYLTSKGSVQFATTSPCPLGSSSTWSTRDVVRSPGPRGSSAPTAK